MDLQAALAVVVPLITFGLLLTVGFDLRAADFRRLRERPAIVFAGLVLPLLLLPASAIGLMSLFHPDPAIATGMLVLAACPIGGLSNFYSHVARASVALSVTLTGLSCLLAVVTLPLLGIVFERVLHQPLALDAPLLILFGQILFMLVLPVSLGMWARHRWPGAIDRHRGTVRLASILGLTALLTMIAFSDIGRFARDLPPAIPIAGAFVLSSFAIGWLVGIVLRARPQDRFTLAGEFATRNVAIAVTLAVTILDRMELASFGTAYVLVEMPLMIGAALVFRARPAEPAEVGAV